MNKSIILIEHSSTIVESLSIRKVVNHLLAQYLHWHKTTVRYRKSQKDRFHSNSMELMAHSRIRISKGTVWEEKSRQFPFGSGLVPVATQYTIVIYHSKGNTTWNRQLAESPIRHCGKELRQACTQSLESRKHPNLL